MTIYANDNGNGNGGEATCNALTGMVVTSSAWNVSPAANYILTVYNSTVASGDLVFVSIDNFSNSAGLPYVTRVSVADGWFAVRIRNSYESPSNFNGTIAVRFLVIKK